MGWHPSEKNYQDLGEWTDEDCETLRPYICSMPVKSNLQPVTLPNKNNCPKGWTSYNFGCYKFHNQNMNYVSARDTCASYDADFPTFRTRMASISSLYENMFHQSFFGSDETNRVPISFMWIGLTRTEQDGQNVLEWDDGYHTAYTHWGINQPSTNNGMRWTVMDGDGNWFLVPENLPDQYPFLCQMHLSDIGMEPAEDFRGELLPCSHHHHGGSSWHEYGSWCFHVDATKLSFAGANSICQTQSVPSHLASIHSQDENNQLVSLVKNITSENAWIGLNMQPQNGWTWVDQSAVGDYSNWAEGNPRGGRLNGDCGSMNQIGQWIDEDCVRIERAFVCQHARHWSNCVITNDTEPCGFAGLNEEQCVEDFKCCFDVAAAVPCFKPVGFSEGKSSSGITNAGAAVLTGFFFLAVPAGFVVWSKYFSKANPMSMTIQNPTFSNG